MTLAKHKGVALIKPQGKQVSWRARYVDPDSKKMTWESLDQQLTAEQRNQWCVAKSKKLVLRRFELDKGATPNTRAKLDETLDAFFTGQPHLRERTVATYRRTANDLKAWCAKNAIKTTDDLTPQALFNFREWLNKRPKKKAVKGSKGKGVYGESSNRRSLHSVNQDLRATSAVLTYLCKKKMFSKLTRADLAESLERFQATHEQPEFLKPDQIKKLIAATEKHDRETFKMTRHDKAACKYVSETVRFEPMTPFVLFVLLTGMRLSEAVDITWEAIDLDQQSIHLKGADTKTKHPRRVDLSITPLLVSILTSLHEQAGKNPRGRVFPHVVKAAKHEMHRIRDCGGPEIQGFTWQLLRSTCGTYLTNAGGIYAGASAYQSAKRLGHSVTIAERHYVGLVNVPKEATTIEAAMGIVPLVKPERASKNTIEARAFAN